MWASNANNNATNITITMIDYLTWHQFSNISETSNQEKKTGTYLRHMPCYDIFKYTAEYGTTHMITVSLQR